MAEMVVVRMNLPWDLTFELGEKKIVINGSKSVFNKQKIMLEAGEYGITKVDKQDWEEIVKRYKSMEIFKQNLIFAMKDAHSADDKAEEMKAMRHGLERKAQIKKPKKDE